MILPFISLWQGKNKGLQEGQCSWSRQSKDRETDRDQIRQADKGHVQNKNKNKTGFMGYTDMFKQKDNRIRISILKTNLCAIWTVLWKESAQMNTDQLRIIPLMMYDRKPRLA